MTGFGDVAVRPPRAYRFDDFRVEPATFQLLKGDAVVHIEPKALELLVYLIEHRERVAGKQELLDEVWRGTVVTENALTRAVAQIRKVLGDDLHSPRYLQTIPTRGYRFIAPLLDDSPIPKTADVTAPAPPRTARGHPAWIIGSMAALGTVAMIIVIAVTLFLSRLVPRAVTRTAPENERRPIVGRRFTTIPGVHAFPTFSSDGASIFYSSDRAGTPHIFKASIADGAEVQLTNGTEGETQPSCSPDGKLIAYVSAHEHGIWVAPANGGAPRQLTTFGSRPAWSPDGKEIAFQSGGQVELGGTAYEALPSSTIWIVDIASGHAEPFTQAQTPSGGHAAPSWRADGKRLIFSSCDLDQCALYTIGRDRTALTEVTADRRRIGSPLFAPDGRIIYYLVTRYDDSFFFSQNVDGNGRAAGGPSQLRHIVGGVMQHLAISRDGSRFAWSFVTQTSNLVGIRLDENNAVSRSAPLTHNAALRSMFPSFSADGSKIAYCAVSAGEDSGVWIADADGSNAKPLAVGAGLKQHAQWSRSGWEVFYAAWAGGAVLFKTSLITGHSSRVSALPGDGSAPMISPDGATIAFNRLLDGKTSVWTMRLDGSDLRRITEPAAQARFPVWSPTGRFLAVQARRADGGSALGVISLSGGSLRMLTNEPGESWPYSWSPDEKWVAFASRRAGVWNISIVSPQSGEMRQLTRNTSTAVWTRYPAWSPKGHQIVYESGEPRSDVWLSDVRVVQ